MAGKYTPEEELKLLENKIKQLQAQGQPIERYVLREIDILQQELDSFLATQKQRQNLENISVVEIEIRQNAVMRDLAKKINKPYDKYEKRIKEAQVRVFGEQNYEQLFGSGAG